MLLERNEDRVETNTITIRVQNVIFYLVSVGRYNIYG